MNETKEPFDAFAIVEIMGHDRYAGRVTEQTIGGCAFVRIDVPEIDGRPAFTKLFGQGAIFSITPVAEDVARAAVKRFRSEPVNVYGLLPAPSAMSVASDYGENVAAMEGDDYDDDLPL